MNILHCKQYTVSILYCKQYIVSSILGAFHLNTKLWWLYCELLYCEHFIYVFIITHTINTEFQHYNYNFLCVFFFSNKVNFQNCYANKLIRWFVFEAVQKPRSTCSIGSKTLGYRLVFWTRCSCFKHYLTIVIHYLMYIVTTKPKQA